MPESFFTGKHTPQRPPEYGKWGSMNAIQRVGVLGLFPFLFLSWIYRGNLGSILGMIGWTSILMGYVAGNLWRYRHALHFWWSISFAGVVHLFMFPIYAKLTDLAATAPGHEGKGYAQLTFALLIIEVLFLMFLLKRVAMWIHRRTHATWLVSGSSENR